MKAMGKAKNKSTCVDDLCCWVLLLLWEGKKQAHFMLLNLGFVVVIDSQAFH